MFCLIQRLRLLEHTHTRSHTDAGRSVAGEHKAAGTLAAERSVLIAADAVGSTDRRRLPALINICQ